ncbi:AMP-dependent synthetase/ligase [Euzebya tangerina]|uniref:AMP-dependent synthetase/ligase n=1 Tax=Euzebya tangerina TaxID=591198 RepID=UPI000E30F051|nr:long-chain fatty acid--CoA ligase [Euzebya tangerina]
MGESTMTREDLEAAIEGVVVGQWLLRNIREHGEDVALRWRTGEDAWGEMTWNEVGDQSARVAARLREWGVEPGDAVGLFLLNRAEFHPADLGGLLCRARSVSIYNSSAPEQVEFLLGHMEAKVVICDSIEFLERVLKVRSQLPELEQIVVVDDPDDLRPDDVTLFSEMLTATPIDLDAAVEAAQPDDIVTLIYTSGTTGTPKGVMLDHRNIAASATSTFSLVGEETRNLRGLSYLPMAHIAERMVSQYGWLFQRNIVTCVPDPTTLATYLAPVKPQGLFGPPRVFEKLRSAVLAGVAARGEEAVAGFEQALALGQQVAAMRAAGQEIPEELAAKHAQVDAAAFAPVRAMLGLDELEYAFAGAAPLPTHVFDFFRGIGIPFSEIYGMSENTGGMTWEPYAVKQGTVGRPIPGTEVVLAEDGEVLCRGPIVSRGYFKDPERTAETFDEDGWLHTGDIGRYDEDGYLSIVDRKKELIITAGGKNISPANIEAELKALPMIGQACVIGDDRPYLTALLVLDPDTAPGWAASQGIEATTLPELAADPGLQAAVDAGIAEVLRQFNNVERIKKWTILGDDWLPDSEQLTATMKLKRRGVHAAYAEEIEAMYR